LTNPGKMQEAERGYGERQVQERQKSIWDEAAFRRLLFVLMCMLLLSLAPST